MIKYHRKFSTYIDGLINAGFSIREVKEPMPTKEMTKNNPGMKDGCRSPMFLLIPAEK